MEYQKSAADLLAVYDGFMQGAKLTEVQMEMQKSVAIAGCFAAAAYEAAPGGGPDVNALTRSFLMALIDPGDAALDYLRVDPATAAATRDASAQRSKLTPAPYCRQCDRSADDFCPDCDCTTCRGTGQVNPLTAPEGMLCLSSTDCPHCDGTGDNI